MYHIFFIHSSVHGQLGWFHVLVMVDSAAVNIGLHRVLVTMKWNWRRDRTYPENPRMPVTAVISYLQMRKQKPWRERELGTKVGLKARATPPGHHVVFKTLVTTMDQASDHTAGTLSLCTPGSPGEPCLALKDRLGHYFKGGRRTVYRWLVNLVQKWLSNASLVPPFRFWGLMNSNEQTAFLVRETCIEFEAREVGKLTKERMLSWALMSK